MEKDLKELKDLKGKKEKTNIKKETKKETDTNTKTKVKTKTNTKPKIKKENEVLDVVYLLDRSGSMANAISDTINGYNSYLNENKDKKIKLTNIIFDDEIDELNYRENIKNIKKLTKETYYARGCTALYDAIGYGIEKLEKEKEVKKVLFIITTDGLENASEKYDKEKIRKLIKKHKDWEFLYLGANIDSYSEASKIGIDKNKTANYKNDRVGSKLMFETMTECTEVIYNHKKLADNWKGKLEK